MFLIHLSLPFPTNSRTFIVVSLWCPGAFLVTPERYAKHIYCYGAALFRGDICIVILTNAGLGAKIKSIQNQKERSMSVRPKIMTVFDVDDFTAYGLLRQLEVKLDPIAFKWMLVGNSRRRFLNESS